MSVMLVVIGGLDTVGSGHPARSLPEVDPASPGDPVTPTFRTPAFTRLDVVNLAGQSTLRVRTSSASGSGWVVATRDGHPLVVTSERLVRGVRAARVNLAGQPAWRALRILSGPCDGIAVLRITQAVQIPALALGHAARDGEQLWSAGFPTEGRAHRGVALSAAMVVRRVRKHLRINDTLLAGMTGGPLLAPDTGDVIGVVTSGGDREALPAAYTSAQLSHLPPVPRARRSPPGRCPPPR